MTEPKRDRTVSFKLGRPYTDQLERLALANGMSPGQVARFVLVTYFEETARHRLADELEALRREVSEFRVEQGLTHRAMKLGLTGEG